MATSQPLVPKGLPKGERQRTVENMQRAGIPLAPRTGQASAGLQASPGPAPVPAGADPVARVLAENTPADFPFLSQPEQAAASGGATPPPAAPQSPMSALAASSQSQFGAAVMSRLLARRGG